MEGDSVAVVRWNGTDWTPVGPLHGYVGAMATLGGRLYAAGDLEADGRALASPAAWDGARWQPVVGGTNGRIDALLAEGPSLWAGGMFSTAGDMPSYGIARLDSVTA